MSALSRDSKGLFVAAGVMAAAVLAIAVRSAGVIGPVLAEQISTFAYLIVPLASGGVCLWVCRRHSGRERMGWALLGLSSIASWSEAGALLSVPLGAAAVICFAPVPKGSLSGLRTFLDATVIAASVFVVSWTLILRSVFERSSGPLLTRVVAIWYPVTDVLIVSLVVFVWSRIREEGRTPMVIVGAALIVAAMADTVYLYLTQRDDYVLGHPIDMAWIASYVLLAVAALTSSASPRVATPVHVNVNVNLPYVVAGAATVVAVIGQIQRGTYSPMLAGGVITLLVIVVARQFLMVIEHQTQTIAHLESVDEMKTRILQAVSHELRTPLTFIKGVSLMLAESVEEDVPLAEQRDLIYRLVTNAERLEHLLGGLLDLERLQRGMVEPSRRHTDVTALLVRIAGTIESPEHDIQVQPNEVVANVDAAQVERIAENLIVNAVRHTPNGTRVLATAERKPGGVLIRVEDDGPGIPADVRDTIFDPFVQVREFTTRGTGIGLALVAHFAELHGGRAWVEDAASGGAAFMVLLAEPQAPASTDVDAPVH